MKITYAILFAIIFTLSASAQTNCSTLEECNVKLNEASRIINKLMDIDKIKDETIAVKDAEISAREQLEIAKDKLIKKREDTIAEQDKLIQLYEKKQRREFSVLFGLIKLRF